MIDPSILLQSQPVNIETPLQAQTQAVNLANMRTSGQLEQAQLQGSNLDNQQKQRDLQDQDAMRRAYMESNGDLDQTSQLAMKYGASPKAMMALQAWRVDQRTKLATQRKDDLANIQSQNDLIGGAMQNVAKETDPAKQAALWNSTQQDLLGRGAITPADVQAHPYPGPDGVKAYVNSLKTNDQLVKEATAAAQAAEAAAKNKDADTNADKFNLGSYASSLSKAGDQQAYETALGDVPKKYADRFPKNYDPTAILAVGTTPGEVLTANTASAAQNETKRHNQADEAAARNRNAIEAGRLNLERLQAGYDANGNPLTAGNASDLARKIAAGQIDPETARDYIRRQPGLLNQVVAVDPNFDEAKLDNRFAFNKRLTDYSPSEIGGQTLALNKLVHHSDLMYQMIDNLNNGSFGPKNKLFNSIATTFGKAPEGDFDQVRDFVVHEAGKLAQGGAPNEADIKQEVTNLASSKSPAALKSHLDKLMQIAGGGMSALNAEGQKYGMGQNFTVLDPDNAPLVQKHGLDPKTLRPLVPDEGRSASPQPSKSAGKPLTDPDLVGAYLRIAGGDKNKARQLAARDGWSF